MIDLFEQSRYGRFDASHFGMWLNADVFLNHPDYKHLGELAWKTFHFPPGGEHTQYVDGLRAPHDATLAASCFTLYSHEARHFHDLIATPYGSVLMRQYARAALFYMFLWRELYFRRRAIVVPITDWVANETIYSQVYQDLQPVSNIITETASIYSTMIEKLDAFNRGVLNSGMQANYPTATSILEGSAVIAQQRAIDSRFGSEVASQFLDVLFDGQAADTYLNALLLLRNVIGGQASAQVMSFLLLSSLYGNFQDQSQRLRYPPDILLQLAVWLKERHVDLINLRSFDDLVILVDRFYQENQGGSLTAMIEQSQRANVGVLESLKQTLKLYEEQDGNEFSQARVVLQCFENFCQAHEIFSRQVLSDPGWYCSGSYIEHQYELPMPVIFIHTDSGVPVDDDLEAIYYIQSEDRMYVTEETRNKLLNDQNLNEAQREWLLSLSGNRSGNLIMRNAYVLSPRDILQRGSQNLIDVDLWQRTHDLVAGLRLFLEGPDRGVSPQTIRQMVSVLKATGTKIYTSAGEMDAPDFDIHETPDMGETLEILKKWKQDNL
jgi:hypothetical protein